MPQSPDALFPTPSPVFVPTPSPAYSPGTSAHLGYPPPPPQSLPPHIDLQWLLGTLLVFGTGTLAPYLLRLRTRKTEAAIAIEDKELSARTAQEAADHALVRASLESALTLNTRLADSNERLMSGIASLVQSGQETNTELRRLSTSVEQSNLIFAQEVQELRLRIDRIEDATSRTASNMKGIADYSKDLNKKAKIENSLPNA